MPTGDGDGVPPVVERAFRDFLQCGSLTGRFCVVAVRRLRSRPARADVRQPRLPDQMVLTTGSDLCLYRILDTIGNGGAPSR